MNEDRKKVWVDPFQTRLSKRIGAYLVVFLIVLCNFLFAWKMIQEGPSHPWRQFLEMLQDYLPVFICLIVLVPVMGWDAIRFSHRLVGPLVRFRRTIRAINQGEAVRPIRLRDGDYLTELRDDFNQMLEELQKQGVPLLHRGEPDTNADSQKKSA